MARTKFSTDVKISEQGPVMPIFRKPRVEYNPEFCEEVMRLGAEGMSINSISLHLGTTFVSVYNWIKNYPEFKAAMEAAEQLSRGWWEEQGRINLNNRNFNAILYMMNMQNRFKWVRGDDGKQPNVVNVNNVNQIIENKQVTIDYSKLSTDDLKSMDSLLSRAIIQH